MKELIRWALSTLFMLASVACAEDLKFNFGSGAPPTGFTQVPFDAIYSDTTGYGFELPGPGSDKPVVVGAESKQPALLVEGPPNGARPTTRSSSDPNNLVYTYSNPFPDNA